MEEKNVNTEAGNAAPANGKREGGRPSRPEMSDEMRAQLAEIRAMDPEMTDLEAVLRSSAGARFREYVGKGLNFVDAYTLAARDRLQTLRDKRTESARRASAAGKQHLSATSSRGESGVSIPADELEMIRKLNPDVSDAEIRRYYSADQKRRGK